MGCSGGGGGPRQRQGPGKNLGGCGGAGVGEEQVQEIAQGEVKEVAQREQDCTSAEVCTSSAENCTGPRGEHFCTTCETNCTSKQSAKLFTNTSRAVPKQAIVTRNFQNVARSVSRPYPLPLPPLPRFFTLLQIFCWCLT